MAGVASEDCGMGRYSEWISSRQHCLSGEALAEWRSSEQVENGTPSTSLLYWDSDNGDGPKPAELYGKYTWKIEKFSQINKRDLRSNAFEVGGYKWEKPDHPFVDVERQLLPRDLPRNPPPSAQFRSEYGSASGLDPIPVSKATSNSSKPTEKPMTPQVPEVSRPSTAPLIPGPRPTVVVSMVQTTPFLARSVSAAGGLGPDPSPATSSILTYRIDNAFDGNLSVLRFGVSL